MFVPFAPVVEPRELGLGVWNVRAYEGELAEIRLGYAPLVGMVAFEVNSASAFGFDVRKYGGTGVSLPPR